MDIFDADACRRIVRKAFGEESTENADLIRVELNERGTRLLEQLSNETIPGTYKLRDQNRAAKGATNVMLFRLGFPRYNAVPSSKLPPFPEVIQRLSERPGGPSAEILDREIRKLVKQIFWLREQLDEQYYHFVGSSPDYFQFHLRYFGLDLLKMYETAFGRSASITRSNGEPSGHTHRFLTTVLFELSQKMIASDLNPSAAAFIQTISPHTIDGWIRKFKHNQ